MATQRVLLSYKHGHAHQVWEADSDRRRWPPCCEEAFVKFRDDSLYFIAVVRRDQHNRLEFACTPAVATEESICSHKNSPQCLSSSGD
jgi:hypothetical protein